MAHGKWVGGPCVPLLSFSQSVVHSASNRNSAIRPTSICQAKSATKK